MENQHQKISGYRELNQEEIDLINRLKRIEKDVAVMIGCLEECDDFNQRHLAIAKTNLETGFMFAIKAVAKPNQ